MHDTWLGIKLIELFTSEQNQSFERFGQNLWIQILKFWTRSTIQKSSHIVTCITINYPVFTMKWFKKTVRKKSKSICLQPAVYPERSTQLIIKLWILNWSNASTWMPISNFNKIIFWQSRWNDPAFLHWITFETLVVFGSEECWCA